MFHQTVLGIPSRNLDLFFTGEEQTRGLMEHACRQGDFALLEGVMGFYDGWALPLQRPPPMIWQKQPELRFYSLSMPEG